MKYDYLPEYPFKPGMYFRIMGAFAQGFMVYEVFHGFVNAEIARLVISQHGFCLIESPALGGYILRK